ncbi:hypothetical protein D3C74_345250 [compost metagenome]
MVCGAIAMMRFGPALAESWCSALDMYVALMPCSRSMSTPSNPYSCMRPYAVSAKFFASVALETITFPFSPPTDRMTLRPCARIAAMSALNWGTVYPFSSAVERLKVIPPGVPVRLSANATATRL